MVSQPGMEIQDAPTDCISRVCFGKSDNRLAVSSWDGTVSLYDGVKGSKLTSSALEAAQLDCCYFSNDEIISVGMDQTVNIFDVNKEVSKSIGKHEDTIKCVRFHEKTGSIITGSWDKTVRLWDPNTGSCVSQFKKIPDRVYALSLIEDYKLIVVTADQQVLLYDLRNSSYVLPYQIRKASLVQQIRCMETSPDNSMYVLSNIEGRVSVNFLAKEREKDQYAFKCHRTKQNKITNIFMVNALSFRPNGNLATGGSDGLITTWDVVKKSKIENLHRYNEGISSLSYNHDGSLLAVSTSYSFEEGEKENRNENKIFIRPV